MVTAIYKKPASHFLWLFYFSAVMADMIWHLLIIWIPAFAGMMGGGKNDGSLLTPHC